ncbi:MAG: hypothetical protein HeimC2_05140 [Candidatus Heimdallarchaeota archaeon LC_2]|nr:MAG: hypothetical protein HeimC2_05140 [Candidatus Heimdallarchaeota archaeon LC_2]
MNNVKFVLRETNRGSTKLFTFVIFMNLLLVLLMAILGLILLGTWFAFFGLILLVCALIKGLLTIGLIRFDEGSQVVDAILSLVLYVLVVMINLASTNSSYLTMFWFSFLFMQFCILIFHPATVRLFHKEHLGINSISDLTI